MRLPSLYQDEPETVEADHLHRTFVQNVSHELRTPLAIMLGYAELLHDGELGALTPQQQEAVFLIVNRAHELRTLVERIGILLAVEAHSANSVPVALNELVAEVVKERRTAATKSIASSRTRSSSRLPAAGSRCEYMQSPAGLASG
jgi:signal transduction histidine kinase